MRPVLVTDNKLTNTWLYQILENFIDNRVSYGIFQSGPIILSSTVLDSTDWRLEGRPK